MRTPNSRLRNVPKKIATVFGAGLLASVAMLNTVQAELVFDDESSQVAPTEQVKISDRDTTRGMVRSAEKAQATVVVQAPTTVQTSSAASSDATEVQNLSRSELMRRERVRAELKNEDYLSERLEELRLRDEKRRTNELLGTAEAEELAPASNARAKTVVMSNQAVGSLETDKVVVAQAQSVSVAAAPVAALPAPAPSDTAMGVAITPRIGIANMNNIVGYTVNPRLSAGAQLSFAVTDNATLEGGYLYNEYGVALQGMQNAYMGMGSYNSLGVNNNENITLKQNVFEAGLKWSLLASESKFRPFISGGGAYAKSFVNYSQYIVNLYNQYGYNFLTNDVVLDQYLGYIGAGMDFKISKNFVINASGRFYGVLSARQTMSNSNGYYMMTPDTDKQYVASSLSHSAFYTAHLGLSFLF